MPCPPFTVGLEANSYWTGLMLRNTFCHIQGIGPKTERELWDQGILSWDDVLDGMSFKIRRLSPETMRKRILESMEHLANRDAAYFCRRLPEKERWRLFRDFSYSAAYLDIETAGGVNGMQKITTIALYDGLSVFHYVYGDNLGLFARRIPQYRLLVTYNGKSFDLPVIQKYFKIRIHQAHIDLRFLLADLGFKGGLKGCEKQMGIDRDELDGLNGFFAVLLWREFTKNRNGRALETLLAYNVLDAVNLETLMVKAYNLKLKGTPFERTHELPLPPPPRNPFVADENVIRKIAEENARHFPNFAV